MGMAIDGVGTLIIIPLTFVLAIYTGVGPVAMYILVKLVDVAKTAAA